MATTSPAAADHQVLHLAMFPFPAFGHISPSIQLCNKLSFHGVRVSYFSLPDFVDRINSLLVTPSPFIQIIPLQPPPDPDYLTNYDQTVDSLQQQIKALLSQLKPNFVLFDFVQHWVPSIASELGIKSLFFLVFPGIASAYISVPCRLTSPEDTPTVSELRKPPPGFPPSSNARLKTFQAEDFFYMFRSFGGGVRGFDRILGGLTGCSGILLKSCAEMEGPYIDYMKTQLKKRMLLTGPLVPEPSSAELDHRWDKWLGQFPAKSVVFCSFGSDTSLSDQQVKELTLGLELTGLPFLLVLNFGKGKDGEAELERTLPKGFVERVKDRGAVHTGWVQQQLILAHASVGCYLHHGGFSSVIEALVNDCQLVMLPFRGDQFFTSMLVSEDWKSGVEVNRRDEDGYFGKEDICEAVKRVMGADVDKEGQEPGKSLRANQKKWHKFLADKTIHDKFISDLVSELKSF